LSISPGFRSEKPWRSAASANAQRMLIAVTAASTNTLLSLVTVSMLLLAGLGKKQLSLRRAPHCRRCGRPRSGCACR
jgi:hypothetical protein